MSLAESPILYSFRRCPYAMRARLALHSSGNSVGLREVVLRDKPAEMLEASPKGTVPVLILSDETVIDESYDVMLWALKRSDPEGLRAYSDDVLLEMDALVAENDGPFKSALDRYKYPNRYQDIARAEQRDKGAEFITKLDDMLVDKEFLFGGQFSIADSAILPFIRQFAHVDRDWFWSQNWRNVIRWLEAFLESDRFNAIMNKYPQWKSGEESVVFGR